jgi:D-alanyl-D-alanine carboxypeptidase (penicillin-binding protein 5/6)
MRYALLLLPLLASTAIHALELNAKSAYVLHPATGTVLVDQNGAAQMGPASLTKMMTLYLLFDAMKNGEVQLTDEFPVSEKAWRMGGSKMFVDVGKTVPVEKLIQGISVVSGNDACVVVAEKLGGTEEGFAGLMNRKAQELGMTNSHFANASGWPDPAQHTSAKDMALLLSAIIRDFPEYQKYLAQEEFEWNGIKQQNRNGLLRAGAGVDVGKTGHTEESGYHLASSAVQSGERLVTVVMGTEGFSQREGESLKAYATLFAQNKMRVVARPGEVVVPAAPVWHGSVRTVDLTVAEPVGAFVSAEEAEKAKVEATYKQPLVAPLAADAPVGEVKVTLANGQVLTGALVPAVAVERGGFFSRWWQTLLSWFGLA